MSILSGALQQVCRDGEGAKSTSYRTGKVCFLSRVRGGAGWGYSQESENIPAQSV
jgi:hypothetical protein